MRNQFTLLLIILLFSFLSFGQKKEKTFIKEFYFASASHELDSTELAKAKKYFKLLDKFNLTKIELYGFTDSDGNNKMNMKLSQKRISTVANLLKDKGYKAERKAEAKGEGNPFFDNDTEEKFKNRRVEVIAYYASKKTNKKKSGKKKMREKTVLVAVKKEMKITEKDFTSGSTIALPSVQFEGGTDRFLSGSKEILKSVIPLIKNKKEIKIEIAGHICCGNEMELSIDRAKKVYNFLIRNGVDKEKLTFKGYNNTQPKYGNIMDVRNRRVELRVL